MKEEGRPSRNQVFPRKLREKDNFAKSTANVWTQQFLQEARTKGSRTKPAEGSSSEEEHMENALALGADEGRDKLRKAAVSCK